MGKTILADMSRFDAIITDIYDEAARPGVWPRALERLRDAVGAQTLVLQMEPDDAPEQARFVATGVRTRPDHIAEWERRTRDQLIALPLGNGRVDVCNDYLARRPRQAFVDLIRRYDVARGMSVDLMRRGRVRYSLHALRSGRQPAFDANESALLGRLGAHFARAMALREAIGEAGRSEMLGHFDAIGIGVMRFDEGGLLSASNGRAEAVLASGMIRTEDARVHIGDDEADRRFQGALAGALADAEGQAGDVGIMLEDGSLLVVRRETSVDPLIGRTRPGALALLYSAHLQIDEASGRFRALHGLTRIEAQIAALMVSGLDAPQIQQRLGIRYSTLRTHIAGMFVKLGCTRQTELVRRLTIGLPLLH